LRDSRFEMTLAPTAFAAASEGRKPAGTGTSAPTAASSGPVEARASSASPAPSSAPHVGGSSFANAGAPWRDLARNGQNRAAFDAVMALGYDRVISEASGADLLVLADVARFSGDIGHARQALVAARGRGEKGRTAFLLGKLAADSSGAPGEA